MAKKNKQEKQSIIYNPGYIKFHSKDDDTLFLEIRNKITGKEYYFWISKHEINKLLLDKSVKRKGGERG